MTVLGSSTNFAAQIWAIFATTETPATINLQSERRHRVRSGERQSTEVSDISFWRFWRKPPPVLYQINLVRLKHISSYRANFLANETHAYARINILLRTFVPYYHSSSKFLYFSFLQFHLRECEVKILGYTVIRRRGKRTWGAKVIRKVQSYLRTVVHEWYTTAKLIIILVVKPIWEVCQYISLIKEVNIYVQSYKLHTLTFGCIASSAWHLFFWIHQNIRERLFHQWLGRRKAKGVGKWWIALELVRLNADPPSLNNFPPLF